MIYFHFLDNGELIEVLSLEDIKWLAKMKIIKEGTTGLLQDDGPETLPCFDDYELTFKNIESMNRFSKRRINKMQSTPGFKSRALEKYCKIIDGVLRKKQGMKVTCD